MLYEEETPKSHEAEEENKESSSSSSEEEGEDEASESETEKEAGNADVLARVLCSLHTLLVRAPEASEASKRTPSSVFRNEMLNC